MNVNKTIDFCFRYRTNIEQAIAEKRLDPGISKTGGSSGNALRSDPTCNVALRDVDEIECVEVPYGAAIGAQRDVFTLRHPERWLKATKMTEMYYSGKLQGQLIHDKYRLSLDQKAICCNLNIGKSLYFVLQNDIFCFATGVAAGLGLVTPRR